MDNVLTDLDHSFLGYLHTLPEYRHITPADLYRLFPDDFGLGSFELAERFKPGWLESPSWSDRPIYPDVLEVLKRLKAKGFWMAIVSAASGRFDDKRAWIAERFGNYVSDIEISGHGDKAEFIRNILARHNLKASETVMIDDRFPNLRSAVAVGIRAVWRKPNIGEKELPADIKDLPTVNNLEEFETWLSKQ
jgi:HAD superfamily hydrolase (TIGR01509 family)